MTMNASTLQSIQSLLAQYGIGSTAGTTATTTNFSDYLMDALDASKKTQATDQSNGLYELIAGNSTSTSMQSLLSLGDSSILSQYLQGSDTTTANLYGTTAATTETTTDMFSSYLQSNFQAKMTSAMNSAKLKLENDLASYRANNDTSNELVKMRLEQMEKNVSLVSNYLQPTSTQATTTSTEQQLMDLLNSNGLTNKSLFNL